MKKLTALLLLILLFLLAGIYFLLYYRGGGICFKPPVCTKNIKTLCHPTSAEIWQGPSLCSCGVDASTLRSRSWIECELPKDYRGTIQTGSRYSIELPSIKVPESLPLFIIPVVFLAIGIGSLIILWKRRG